MTSAKFTWPEVSSGPKRSIMAADSCILHYTVYMIFLHTVMAVSAVANIVKSSLGPVGLDKMLVDDVGVSLHLINL